METGDSFDSPIVEGEMEIFFAAARGPVMNRVEELNFLSFMHCPELALLISKERENNRTCPIQGRVGYSERSRSYRLTFLSKDSGSVPQCQVKKEHPS